MLPPAALVPQAASAAPVRVKWDREVDVIVVGSGAMGLPAALRAQQAGASVLLLEATRDIGGHAIVSGGNVPLGGGTSVQKKYGIADSPDLLFKDLVDWSVIEPNGFPDYRYNDREIIRAFADNSAATFEWLVAQGVTFVNKGPDNAGGTSSWQLSLSRNALRAAELCASRGRCAISRGGSEDDVARRRLDASAGGRREKGQYPDSA